MIRIRKYLGVLLCAPALAYAWSYSPVMTVSEYQDARTYQHLESSGNRAIAISQSVIAVTWEDNHSGKPQVYVAFKQLNGKKFSPAMRVSHSSPAYEPSLAGLWDGRFVVTWEASGHVWARVVGVQHTGPVIQLSKQPAREATLSAASNGRLWLAWAEKAGTHFHIMATTALVDADRIKLSGAKPVDPVPPKQDQHYPSIALTSSGSTIGWEDRRFGHTRLFTAFAAKGKWFGPYRQINYLKPWSARAFGKGTGSMRVVLASDGKQKVVGCWLDKRDFMEGYDVYAAFSQDGGKTFGKNKKVEDMLGANQAQWHAVSAMDNQGHALVAWDDQRDGSPDLWLSWYTEAGWSDDDSPPAANGSGSQTHPAMVFDTAGRLHLAFLDRHGDSTAIRYLVATP